MLLPYITVCVDNPYKNSNSKFFTTEEGYLNATYSFDELFFNSSTSTWIQEWKVSSLWTLVSGICYTLSKSDPVPPVKSTQIQMKTRKPLNLFSKLYVLSYNL